MSPDFGIADIIALLFVTIGPLKAAIVYSKMTATAGPALKKQIAFSTVTVATIVCLVFVFFGQNLLNLFHVSLPALKIAGGLILLLFALDMVLGEHKDVEGGDLPPSPEIAIYPLAIPLMATPQGLVAITAIVAETQTFVQKLAVAAIVLAVMALNLVILLSAGKLGLGKSAGRAIVISKVMGLLLSALAVQLMISAFRDLGLIAAAAQAH